MKALLLITVLALCAVAYGNAPYGIKVLKSYKTPATRIIQWMTANRMGGNSWVLRFHQDPRCANCPFMRQKDPKKWPQQCNSCVAPFKAHLMRIPECKKCVHKNKKCKQCHKKLKTMEKNQIAIRDKQATPFMRSVIYV